MENSINNQALSYNETMTDEEWNSLYMRLSRSAFRSRFHLSGKDMEYIHSKGIGKIREHAEDFVRKRLAPSFIPNDGKQTPMKGHPVFIAQHATACCCRSCLGKWHHIPKGRELTEREINYVTDVIMRWIDMEIHKDSMR